MFDAENVALPLDDCGTVRLTTGVDQPVTLPGDSSNLRSPDGPIAWWNW